MTQIIEKGCIMPIVPLGNSGQDFAVRPEAITLFDLQAKRQGGNLIMGAHLSDSYAPYLLTSISPGLPVLPEILALIDEDKSRGQLHRTRRVLLDNRSAIYLYFERVIRLIDFNGASHTKINLSKLPGLNSLVTDAPVIHLPQVLWGTYRLPLYIVSERLFDNNCCTLDENNEIV